MDTNEMIALLLPPNGCYKCSDTRKEIAEELARRAAAQPVAWATPSLLVTLSAVEKNHLTNPDRRTRGGEFESAAADAERYSVPLYAAPPAAPQGEPQLTPRDAKEYFPRDKKAGQDFFRAMTKPAAPQGEPQDACVTVSGPTGCGKSFVMETIYHALRDAGLHPYSDDLAQEQRMVDQQPKPSTKVWRLEERNVPRAPAPQGEPPPKTRATCCKGAAPITECWQKCGGIMPDPPAPQPREDAQEAELREYQQQAVAICDPALTWTPYAHAAALIRALTDERCACKWLPGDDDGSKPSEECEYHDAIRTACEEWAERAKRAEADLAAATERAEKAEVDAERYRWLRDKSLDVGDSWAPMVFPADERSPLYGNALDESIDHYRDRARAEGGKAQGASE